MSSILAVVVSFHPKVEILKNVKALLQQVSHVVIIDNESTEESKGILSALATAVPREKVSFIINDGNKGVGEGFNQGIRWGLEQSYDYFLMMDQDSCPKEMMVENLLAVTESYEKSKILVLVGPHHEDFDRKIATTNTEAVERAPLLISSGSLISKALIEVVGLYDEKLFIDHVDHDYCLRVIRKGGRCLKVNSARLLHRFGEAQVKTFFGKPFFLQDYPPFRRYHMMRNRIVLYKRYGMFSGDWFWLDLKVAIKDLIKLLLFEQSKGTKLLALLRGVRDGLLWRDSK